jgi:hypothetical protein
VKTNGIRYGNKSSKPEELQRRARKKGVTIEELLKIEQEEQDKIDSGYTFCNSCKEWKIFGKAKTYCKDCCSKRTQNNYSLEKQRVYLLKKKYGITPEKYDEMLSEQDYKCYICHKHEDKLDRSLAVDHCHSTGKVRGLLCGNCNRFLGQINDDIDTAKRIYEYLQKHKDIQENSCKA